MNLIIYGKTQCVYCQRAKNLLNAESIGYNYINLDDKDKNFINNLKEQSQMSTVPIIYNNKELIGGFLELKSFLSKNLKK